MLKINNTVFQATESTLFLFHVLKSKIIFLSVLDVVNILVATKLITDVSNLVYTIILATVPLPNMPTLIVAYDNSWYF
jgi:uncharacterized membrane protein